MVNGSCVCVSSLISFTFKGGLKNRYLEELLVKTMVKNKANWIGKKDEGSDNAYHYPI